LSRGTSGHHIRILVNCWIFRQLRRATIKRALDDFGTANVLAGDIFTSDALTGLSGAGKSTIALAVELATLFRNRYMVCVLALFADVGMIDRRPHALSGRSPRARDAWPGMPGPGSPERRLP
jgi:hypothetical protein